MMKKRVIIKIICFAAVFVLLFVGAGQVLAYNWSPTHFLAERYEDFEEEAQVDVIYAGGSNAYVSIAPIVIWHQTGLTGYNFATGNSNPMLVYYQLKYAFSVNKPKLVVLDVTGLDHTFDPTVSSPEGEAVFQRVFSTLPDRSLRYELLRDMKAHWPDIDTEMYLFPALRYHTRWEELTQDDFDRSGASEKYRFYRKGCYMSVKTFQKKMPEELYEIDDEVQEINMEYLEKIWGLCQENGVQLMLVNCPKMSHNQNVEDAVSAFAGENGLNYLYYRTMEELKSTGLDPKKHFYDKAHTNIWGQRVFSEFIAGYLTEHYSFETHESDTALCESWDQCWNQYEKYYKNAGSK